MSLKLGHPAPTSLAGLHAGLPGSRRGRRLSAHIARCSDCARVCAQLDGVTATLQEAPHASLPTAVEYRIVIAMMGEAARRQASRPRARRRASRSPFVPFIVAPALTGALAVFGCVLSMTRTGPLGPSAGGRPPASRPARPARPAGHPGGGPAGSAAAGSPASGADSSGFLVTDSDIAYYKGTLPSQLRHSLAVQASDPPVRVQLTALPTAIEAVSPGGGPGAGPGRDRVDIAAEVTPSKALVGCVLHLTGDVEPRLVDRATYQSEQVYVIAVTDEAWVVGIGCTASRPTVITSIGLGSTG